MFSQRSSSGEYKALDQYKKNDVIYFVVKQIVVPSGMLTEEYNEYERDNVFMIARVELYTKDLTKKIHKTQTIAIKIKQTILLHDYLVWEVRIDGVQSSKWKSKEQFEFTIGSIVDWHLLPLEARNCENIPISDVVRHECPTVFESLFSDVPFEKNEDITPEIRKACVESGTSDYFLLYQLMPYRKGLRYWKMGLEYGFSISKLIERGEELKFRPLEFILKYPKKRFTKEQSKELFQNNPFEWNLLQCTQLTILSQMIEVLEKNLEKHITYLNSEVFYDQVNRKIGELPPIVSKIIKKEAEVNDTLGGYDPRLAAEILPQVYRFATNTLFVLEVAPGEKIAVDIKESEPRTGEHLNVYSLRYWKSEQTIINAFRCLQKNTKSYLAEKSDSMEEVAVREEMKELPDTLSEEQRSFIYSVLTNREAPFHVLSGRAGCGKSETIKHLIHILLKRSENALLLAGFMGKTISMLGNRIVVPFEKEYEQSGQSLFLSKTDCRTIHTFCGKTDYYEFPENEEEEEEEGEDVTEGEEGKEKKRFNTEVSDEDVDIAYDKGKKKTLPSSENNKKKKKNKMKTKKTNNNTENESKEKKKPKEMEVLSFSTLADEAEDGDDDWFNEEYKKYYEQITHIFVDEIGVVDTMLLARLLKKLPRRGKLIKIIFLGDHDQILSISSGDLMNDLMKACRYIDEHNKKKSQPMMVELTKNFRFQQSASGGAINSMDHNMMLIYDRDPSIDNKFIWDSRSITVPYQKNSNSKIHLEKQLLTILEKENGNNVQIYTYTREMKTEVARNLVKNPEYQKMALTSESSNNTTPKFNLPTFTHDTCYQPGTHVMVTHNRNAFTKELFVVSEQSIHDVLEEEWTTSKTFSNVQQMFSAILKSSHDGKGFVDRCAKCKKMSVPYVSNGQVEIVDRVEFGFTKGEKSGAILDYYIIYHLRGRERPWVIGEGAISPNDLEYGICTTVNKMQGWESQVVVYIIPAREAGFVDYRTFLVGATRGRERIYYMVESQLGRSAGSIFKSMVLRDSPERKSHLAYKILTGVFQQENSPSLEAAVLRNGGSDDKKRKEMDKKQDPKYKRAKFEFEKLDFINDLGNDVIVDDE